MRKKCRDLIVWQREEMERESCQKKKTKTGISKSVSRHYDVCRRGICFTDLAGSCTELAVAWESDSPGAVSAAAKASGQSCITPPPFAHIHTQNMPSLYLPICLSICPSLHLSLLLHLLSFLHPSQLCSFSSSCSPSHAL